MYARTVTVVAGTVKDGTCRYCHDRILWATTASAKGRPAKTLPFNRPRPWSLSEQRNDETGVSFEVWPADALHFTTCRNKPAPAKKPQTAPPAAVPVRIRKGPRSLFDEGLA